MCSEGEGENHLAPVLEVGDRQVSPLYAIRTVQCQCSISLGPWTWIMQYAAPISGPVNGQAIKYFGPAQHTRSTRDCSKYLTFKFLTPARLELALSDCSGVNSAS